MGNDDHSRSNIGCHSSDGSRSDITGATNRSGSQGSGVRWSGH